MSIECTRNANARCIDCESRNQRFRTIYYTGGIKVSSWRSGNAESLGTTGIVGCQNSSLTRSLFERASFARCLPPSSQTPFSDSILETRKKHAQWGGVGRRGGGNNLARLLFFFFFSLFLFIEQQTSTRGICSDRGEIKRTDLVDFSSQGNREGRRAEQFFANVSSLPSHGSHSVRDLEEKATQVGQRKSRSADGRGQGCESSDRGVPTSVSQSSMELLHQEFPPWEKSLWQDRGQR